MGPRKKGRGQSVKKERFWLRPVDEPEVSRLAEEWAIHPTVARILWIRGIRDRAGYDNLTALSHEPASPSTLPDMDRAVGRIQEALRRGEHIRVFGDYDADGVTATALMVRGLKALGARVDYDIPDRFDEGYGLYPEAVLQAVQDGVQCLITVDCGSSSPAAADTARRLGLDLVITDHHALPESWPQAVALVNPERMDQPDRLSGAGVALQVLRALWPHDVPEAFYGLAAIGTVADVVPLVGNNRVIVRRGLLALRQGEVPGIGVLVGAEGRDPRHLSAEDLGFFVGPRLNAAGRMGQADPAVKILLADSEEQAQEPADQLRQANRLRRQTQEAVLAEAWAQVVSYPLPLPSFMVVAGDKWHEGVLGIVAARLKEVLRRPVAVIGWGEHQGKGSARGVDGLDLIAHMRRASDHFLKLGGHRGAAGFTLARQDVKILTARLSEGLPETARSQQRWGTPVDAQVSAAMVGDDFWRDLKTLEPFGHGFERPRMWVVGQVDRVWTMGHDKSHLRIRLKDHPVEGVAFGHGAWAGALTPGRTVRLVVEPTWSYFGGVLRAQWMVSSIQGVAPWAMDWPSRSRLGGHEGPWTGRVIWVVDNPRQLKRLARERGIVPYPYTATWGDRAAFVQALRDGRIDQLAVSQWRPWPDLAGWADHVVWLVAPRHRHRLAEAAYLLSVTGRQWLPADADGLHARRKSRRLSPDRDRLARVWRQWQAGAAGLAVGIRVFHELGLVPGAAIDGKRSLTLSFSYNVARQEETWTRESWQSPLLHWIDERKEDEGVWHG